MNADDSTSLPTYENPIHVVTNSGDPLAHFARLILERHAQQLPDLSQVIILIPDLLIARRIRQRISRAAQEKGFSALLGPTINTLRTWVENTIPINTPVMSVQARELMLIESLYQHSALFGESNPWYLASSLISLFDEMTLQHVDLPASLDDFIDGLDKSYGLNSVAISAFTREATLIHTLWHAWHKQQYEEGMIDSNAAYLARLTASLRTLSSSNSFYIVGYHALLPCEAEWVQLLINVLNVVARKK